MSGGNISDGQNEGSGNVIDMQEKRKTAPLEVNEKRPPVRPVEQQLEKLKERYNRDRDRWVDQTNKMSAKLRELRERAATGLLSLRNQLDKDKEALEMTNMKFEKYLTKSMEQEEEIERLCARIMELEDAAK